MAAKKKLTGKKKKAFLARMARGRKKAAAKKGRKPGKRKAGTRKVAKRKVSRKPAAKRKAGKRKAGKRKAGKRRIARRGGTFRVDTNRSSRVKNITCAIVKIDGQCRRICFATTGKQKIGSRWNRSAKRFLLDNRPAKNCGGKNYKYTIPKVILRGIVGL